MLVIQNHCCGCELPCINCGLRHVEVAVCDSTGCEENAAYLTEDGDLCEDCLSETLNDMWDALSIEEKAELLNFKILGQYD